MRYEVVTITSDKGTEYGVADASGHLVIPVCRFLKSLRNRGRSANTQRSYAYSLCLYFRFLDDVNLNFRDVNFSALISFLGWLQTPEVVSLHAPAPKHRSETTVNAYTAGVLTFYRYLQQVGELGVDLDHNVYAPMENAHPKYKRFLEHLDNKNPLVKSNLHVKEKRRKVEVLTPQQVAAVFQNTQNSRDRLLVYLLFISGLRIGEALALQHGDLIFDHSNGHRIQVVERENPDNQRQLKTGERDVYVNQRLMDLYDDYVFDSDLISSNDKDPLFIKLQGQSKGTPLTYGDVAGIFRRLSTRSSLRVTPHLLRHTHATIFYAKTRNAKQLQERLGHADVQTTLNKYVHPTNEEIITDWKNAVEAFQLKELAWEWN